MILRDIINPYLLRRLKQDVDIGLPSKTEQVCSLINFLYYILLIN